MLRKRRRNRYKFTEKKQSKKGIITLCMALLIEIIFVLFLYMSYESNGRLSMYYGSAGILLLGLSVVNFCFAIKSMFDDEVFMTFPRLASFLSFVTILSWGGIYIIGWMI